jgi:hypothetical protein
MENNEVHVRSSEVAAEVAVKLGKLADATGVKIRTFHSVDEQGFGNQVAVTDVMWSGGTHPTIVIVLANGQEFEAEVRPSSKAIREARTALDCATQVAERAQDAAKAARKEV